MAHFEEAVEKTLAHEGGYVSNPNDPGGETNFGISRRSYPDVDIRNLSVDQAVEIYRRDFWLPVYEGIRSQRAANMVFDMAVNHGAAAAHRLAQEACRTFRFALRVDGQFGLLTLGALNGATLVDEDGLLRELRARRAELYARIALARPSSGGFLLGWMRRNESFI
jgi:lysozyme family protein